MQSWKQVAQVGARQAGDEAGRALGRNTGRQDR